MENFWEGHISAFLGLLVVSTFQASLAVNPAGAIVTYDYIIVGGGTAGCVLANRLSASNYSVLVLEAGKIPPDEMFVPGYSRKNEVNPDLTFQYESVPQKRAALGEGGVVPVHLGRVLGGTSNINLLIWNRGSPKDFDNWVNYTGDESWKYSNMLKYFKRSETYMGQFGSDQHGSDGPITVSRHNYVPGQKEWLDAGQELGFKLLDPNGPQENSVTPIEFNTKFGRRISSYVGYIKPIMDSRKNLKIILNATVTKVIVRGNTALGVQYNVNGSVTSSFGRVPVALAKREVILSAGAYGSPAILQRSGIGPRNVLLKAGIPLVKELPVGENFQDHPVVPLFFILGNKSLSLDPPTDFNDANLDLWEKTGEGPYTSAGGFVSQIFFSTSIAKSEGHSNWADMDIALTSITTRLPLFEKIRVEDHETTIMLKPYLARCKSRGTVQINPKNVNGMPIIDFNYYDDPRDERIHLEAIDLSLRLFETTNAYKKVGARYPDEPVKGCEDLQFRSEEYWRCFMRQALIGGNHPSSTCSMNHVVDSSFRVFGIQKLRVVDASIMPFITNSNLQAAIYGIAEKAADVILGASKRASE